jgi:transglutaminase-like putative cysteine protease
MIKQAVSRKRFLWQLLFLCLPTVVLAFLMMKAGAEYFPVFNNHRHTVQTAYFAAGLIVSCFFYSYRFRFIPSFVILLLLFWLGNKFLDNFAFGEFDSFFWAIDFFIFQMLFIAGWICGCGFSRMRYFPAIFSALLLGSGVALTALTGKTQFAELTKMFAPVMVYAFYIIYMSELLRNIGDNQPKSWLRPVKGLFAYCVIMCLLLLLAFTVFKPEFKALEVKWGEGGRTAENNDKGMLETMPDSTLKVKNKMSLNDNMNRNNGEQSDFPLFVTYIDNFLPGTDVPNPLYFITDYLTKFDDYTETFEHDSLMPYNDLFSPDPSTVPLYFTTSDSTVLINGMSTLFRKSVDAEVYKIRSSPTEFTAPSTAYFCQPIAVKPELKDQFKSAYRAKMWVSELNSAYFVYNNVKKDYNLQRFQQQRFDLLKSVRDFSKLDTAFYRYYTSFPANPAYDTVRYLADSIVKAAGAVLPVDKILAVRDFFMSGNDEGKPKFRYSDVATTVPPGQRLLNFLLNDHKGNCTYYAGSTLFLLRACGIPTRVAVGYALIDRSSNNKGWYWVYNKQAHAWVQAFFPEYGWLDFDTTFGDSEREEAPGTDGTPPLDPQKAWFAATGKILKVDTLAKIMQFDMDKMVYHDLEYKLETPFRLTLDMSLAQILADSLNNLTLSALKPDDRGLSLSFNEPKNSTTIVNPQDVQMILVNLPKPMPVDEFRLETVKREKEQTPAAEVAAQESSKKIRTWIIVALTTLAMLLMFTIAVFSMPYIIYCRYSKRARRISDATTEAYYPYRAATFILNQMGYKRGTLTPLKFAGQVDKELGTMFETFTAIYLRAKYAGQALNTEEIQRVMSFYTPFEQAVKAKFTFRQRLCRFMNIYNTLEFYTSRSVD